MTIKNKYYNRSRISEAKFREIIKYFALDLNATQITTLTNLNRNTINKVLYLIRQRILLITQLQSALP
jgi:transposase